MVAEVHVPLHSCVLVITHGAHMACMCPRLLLLRLQLKCGSLREDKCTVFPSACNSRNL